MIHLSARLAWHDSGWDGCVCQAPHLNASCIVLDTIRDERDDEAEVGFARKHIADLGDWHPPCTRDIGAYSSRGYQFRHTDPLRRSFLTPITEDIPPYSVLPAPYRWLREELFREICEVNSLKIRGPKDLKRQNGWVYEPYRQTPLLKAFWDRVKEGEGKSLIFYYCNQGNPVDENALRLVVGVGRLKSVGPQLYFIGTDDSGDSYPIWTRTISQDFPAQGFRIPYQEYLRQGLDPRSIACYVPPSALLPFSFVGEHVTDDMAVGILERLIQAVEEIKRQGMVDGEWDRHLLWLNDCLAEVWQNRGPYPGIGSVLQYLNCSRGTAFQQQCLPGCIREGRNPWESVKAILSGQEVPPQDYAADFERARRKWAEIKNISGRLELLDNLVRCELSTDQVRRICTLDERQRTGIPGTDHELAINPYIICETDRGTTVSEPIALDSIDRGMLPEGEAALFIAPQDIIAPDDARRVRGVAVTILREAAQLGDSLLTFDDLLDRIRIRFSDRRICSPDRAIVVGQADFYRERLWLDLDRTPQLVALKFLQAIEEHTRTQLAQRAKRANVPSPTPIDWNAALIARFGAPKTDRARMAQQEKEAALHTLFGQKLSVLVGSAGTGKTSVLDVLLKEIERVEGNRGVYLLAPTGKARVRLSSITKRNAFTIHQLLLKLGWFDPGMFALREASDHQASAPTVIIDEASMVPVDLLGTLFKALQLDLVKRLILVGDPNQLPPIGPGRPFVDLVDWLRSEHPQCVATLRTSMRTVSETDERPSRGLAFAEGYRGDTTSPGDDELFSAISTKAADGDLEVYFWNNHEEMEQRLRERLRALVQVGDQGDYQSFNQSLGITKTPWEQPNWKGAENWQILSPLRSHPFGTEELNRTVQLAYKRGLIEKSKQPWSKQPSPFGDQEIVYTDKVIQIINQRMSAYPRDPQPLDYVANGEIGIVTSCRKGENGDHLDVGFSTQDAVTYRYYRNSVDVNLELAYALTVHKSQGSDFDTVFLIVPLEAQTLSRELIYTGLTRFRKKMVLLVERDTTTLQKLRLRSDAHQRNTNLFKLILRPDQPRVPYPEGRIHRSLRDVMMRSKSEVIVADVLDKLGLTAWQYEQPLAPPDDARNFRLPDFTIGYQGDIYYWEHLGMLHLPTYAEEWKRKRQWYEQVMHIPVIGPGARDDLEVEPGRSPVVLTSKDSPQGAIDQVEIERLARRYILLES